MIIHNTPGMVLKAWCMMLNTSGFCMALLTYPALPRAMARSDVPSAIPILLPSEMKAYWNPSFLMPVFHSPYSTQSGMMA